MTTVIIHDPGNYMGKIDHVWVYLSVDAGGEGVCAIQGMPLVMADKRIADKARPMVEHFVKMTGKPVRLAKFSQREDIELISP